MAREFTPDQLVARVFILAMAGVAVVIAAATMASWF